MLIEVDNAAERLSVKAAVPQQDDPSPRIANPAVGMQGTMLRAGSETNGELFEVEFLVEPGDRGSGRRGPQDMVMFSLLPGE